MLRVVGLNSATLVCSVPRLSVVVEPLKGNRLVRDY